ncbi:PucR family transcriptional regulator [Helicovermis profundi]|uniref:PucR family transcriptional regulator n=1 Tax=Helicovermis profundi TaxID=3065157 RepID=A0AAU9EQS5_9FIRM|nr:PucR family transcriptional regulator [Clostridia bacterium S502]
MNKELGISVEELLKLPVLKNAKIISGVNGRNRTITKINVMEVPDIINWVKKGEFLLTTAFSIKDDLNILKELIVKMNRIGLSGIGIKTKRYIEKIPKNILDIANELDFPIIEIPYDVSFGDIITPALSKIVNKQATVLKQIDLLNQSLTSIMLKGGGLKEISDSISNNLKLPVAIIDDVFKESVISFEDGNYEGYKEIINLISKNSNLDILIKEKDLIDGKKTERIQIPILSEEKCFGSVVLWQTKRILTSMEQSVIESSVSLIALNIMKRLSIFENENRHKIEFIDDLLSDNLEVQSSILEKADYFNFNINYSYTVIELAINKLSEKVKLTPNNADYLETVKNTLMNIVDRVSRISYKNVIYAKKSNRVYILFGSKKDMPINKVKSKILEYSNYILKYAEEAGIKENLSIGIGRNYSDLKKLYNSKREAKRSVENLILKNSSESLIHYDELGIYKLLSYEELKPELYQFYLDTLEPLVKYDREKETELVDTLAMYYKCGGNLKRVSEKLYTHYNTIIYRIQRIKEIINIDLDNSDDSLNLQIALKIVDIIDPN